MGNTSFGKAPAWQAQRPKFWPQNPGRNTCDPSTEETVSPGGQASWTGSVNQKESALVWLQPLQQGPGCRRPAFLTSFATNSPHGLAKPRTCVKLRLGITKRRQKSLTMLPCLRDHECDDVSPHRAPHDLSHTVMSSVLFGLLRKYRQNTLFSLWGYLLFPWALTSSDILGRSRWNRQKTIIPKSTAWSQSYLFFFFSCLLF